MGGSRPCRGAGKAGAEWLRGVRSRAHLKDRREVKREKGGVEGAKKGGGEGAKRIIEVVPAWLQWTCDYTDLNDQTSSFIMGL